MPRLVISPYTIDDIIVKVDKDGGGVRVTVSVGPSFVGTFYV